MKFLLDVCASARSLQAALTEWGHDVVSAVNIDPRANGPELVLAAEALIVAALRPRFNKIVRRKSLA